MKKFLVTTAMLILGSINTQVSASEPTGTSLSKALTQCADISNSLKRLVCYDQLASKVNNFSDQPLTAPTPVAASNHTQSAKQANSVKKPVASAEDDFGREHKTAIENAQKKMTSIVDKVTETLRGKLIITLANGQVWQQADSTTLRIKAGQQVVLERGILNSFFISRPTASKRMKVKRIK
ncbi:hypothetical protein [Flocculibacter collagenilyticus]|uniref:hypothetical protein n=1 Tax=Flocculibacter collagenilyticus TaxID=2744479 RepID=UPI0018F4C229|nr:hypothetical protein [Flocculibacter collagenilyticus]